MSADSDKKVAAERAVTLVEDGMMVGLGTGSTAAHFVRLLGERVAGGLKVKGVPTSEATRKLARECKVPMTGLKEAGRLQLTVDGTDEVDPQLRLIKGAGGALLREKIVAASSDMLVIIADASKVVQQLGACPLPVEIVPFGLPVVQPAIAAMGAKVVLRGGENAPFVTDEGHFVLDCSFKKIDDPEALATRLNAIPGVVEHGLFLDMADRVIIGRNGDVKLFRRKTPKV